ncbi:MAG: DUF167 domain-containing protein [Planctomycetes bacterium]|nr:DUF167 domain-containing protein [Planctomycetota bacterium]
MDVRETDGGAVFSVKVVPGSSRTSIAGILGGMLKVKVAAAAEKGQANKCLVGFLAEELGVRARRITIVSGQSSPVKQLEIVDISAVDLNKQLQRLVGGADK